jgi:DNA-binding HxlR family transcriptional regulator
MGIFGRKWALLVLRDIALKADARFTDIIRANPGMTPRILAFRLRELEAEGLIRRRASPGKREVRYTLTPAGRDTIPILTALIYFGTKHRAHEVFRDGRPRTMMEQFPRSQRQLLQGMAEWAAVAELRAPRRTGKSAL